jgi:hypothetical protein
MDEPRPLFTDEDWTVLNTMLDSMAWILGAYKPLMFIARQIDIYLGID